jgi:ABC-type glycerol-3-phosphate transport system permease component
MIVTKGGTMKRTSTGVVSGCLVWILAFGVISTCILPVSMAIGGFTSASDYAINFTGKFICPDGTTPESYSYATTTRDENGNEQPSTAYELHCVAANGEVLKSDPVGYSFLWIGIFAAIGLVLTSILAFVLAAPAGVLISKLLNRTKKQNAIENIELQ